MAERRFPATMAALREALSWILARAKAAGLPDSRLFKVELACEEALSNVIRYAYPDRAGEVRISAEQIGEGFGVCFEDDGVPFNPLEADAPDTDAAPLEREPGGLGVFMVKEMTDEISYRRATAQNRLTLVWFFHQNKRIQK